MLKYALIFGALTLVSTALLEPSHQFDILGAGAPCVVEGSPDSSGAAGCSGMLVESAWAAQGPEPRTLCDNGPLQPGDSPTAPGSAEAGPDGCCDAELLVLDDATFYEVLGECPSIMLEEWIT